MSSKNVKKTAELLRDAFVWDAHACFPLKPHGELKKLKRYRNNGVDFVSINIGMDMDPPERIMQVVAGFRRYIKTHSDNYLLAESVEHILEAKKSGRLAVAFDLEGSEPLGGNIDLIALYFDLGVRQMLLAYNKDNHASGGCLEGKIGLTNLGKEIIREMNRVGMVVDLSHMGLDASLEAMEISTAPVVFSHSNPKSVFDHERNITDEQIKACAGTGGVIGINGIGMFLGEATAERFLDHVGYVVDVVGPKHVGIGLDYTIDKQELQEYIKNHPDVFPPAKMNGNTGFIEPEQFPKITGLLLRRGYAEKDVRAILGGNFLRLAEQVWRTNYTGT